MTTKEAIKRAKRVKEEQWCECIGNCSCNAEGDKNACSHLISIAERVDEERIEKILLQFGGDYVKDKAKAIVNYLEGR